MSLIALGLFAVACRPGESVDDDSSASTDDLDGDGFATPADCADDDGAVHPDAEERCDGIDNNCDGETDGADAIGASVWYADADADGFGNPDLVRVACDPPSEYFLDNADDCDDEREDVFPGAQEYCDGIDDDCDGAVDEEDALDKQLVYVDADGDGAGDPDSTSMQCGVPAGFASTPDDCDDTNAAMSPYQTEVCNDGLDNDCEGTAAPCGLEGEKDLPLAEATILGDGGDHLGLGMASGDLDGDGDLDLAVRGDSLTSKTWVYVLEGPLTGTIDASVTALAKVDVNLDSSYYGPPGDALDVFDVDGDGYDDLVAGSTGSGGGASNGIFVFTSPFSGSIDVDDGDFSIGGNNVGGSFERVGDLDDDGEPDFLVTNSVMGTVYVVPGPMDRDLSTDDADVSIESPCGSGGGGCRFGTGLGKTGDLDGDGSLDLVIGAPEESLSYYSFEGTAYIYAGPLDSAVDGEDFAAQVVVEDLYRAFGTVIDLVPDVDGDGYDDLLFGNGSSGGYLSAPSGVGQAGLFYGPVTDELSLSDADFLFEGEGGDATGISVALADTNGDGIQDLVVGDATEDGEVSHAGAVFAVVGPLGTGKLGTADADGRIQATSADLAGSVVRSLGDMNADGLDDIGIGGPTYQATDGGQGAAFLVFGGGM